MKFSASLFAAAAPCLLANGALAAALPPVTDGLNLDPSNVGTSVVNPSTISDTIHDLAKIAFGNTEIVPDDVRNHLAFLSIISLPNTGLDLPAGDIATTVQNAQLIIENEGYTEVLTVTVSTVTDIVIDTVDAVIPGGVAESVNVKSALTKVTKHVTGVIDTDIDPEYLFFVVIPNGVHIHDYFGLPAIVGLEDITKKTEKRQNLETPAGADKTIQIIRFLNGKSITAQASISIVGVSLVKAWPLANGN